MGEQASEGVGSERPSLKECNPTVASATGPQTTFHVCESLMRIEAIYARSGESVFVTMGAE